jgi:transposase
MEAMVIMRALEPRVLDAVWAAAEPLLPVPIDQHPLGCHRPRISDRVCFQGIFMRMVLGCSWQSVEYLLALAGHIVSDTTLRARRTLWVNAGIFEHLEREANLAYDRIVGLDLSDVAIDGSAHKAPCGGPGTGKSPTDRGKHGWKWSLMADRNGIPLGWDINAANRHDTVLFGPTLTHAATRFDLTEIETLHLDRGYDSAGVRALVATHGITDLVAARQRRGNTPIPASPADTGHGMRWPVERSHSWLSNYGQLRRNTDRQPSHRHAQLALAITTILVIKLFAWHDRWNKPPPNNPPIR